MLYGYVTYGIRAMFQACHLLGTTKPATLERNFVLTIKVLFGMFKIDPQVSTLLPFGNIEFS